MQKKLRINSFCSFFLWPMWVQSILLLVVFPSSFVRSSLTDKGTELISRVPKLSIWRESFCKKKKKGKWRANSECFSNTSNTFLCLFISDLVKSWATKTTTEKWFFGQKKLGINSFVRLFVTNVSKLLLVFFQVSSDL